MRFSMILVASSALALAACGDTTTVDDPSDADQVAEASAQLPNPEPGEYRMVGELVEFEAPGAPEQDLEMARTFMAAIFANETTMCLTQEEADEGYRRFAEGMSEGDDGCEMTSYETTSSTFTSVMSCSDEAGGAGTTTVSGEVSGDSMDITMTMEGTDAQMGEMRMVLNMQGERIGDCSSEG